MQIASAPPGAIRAAFLTAGGLHAGQPVFFQVENDPETSVLGGRDPGRNGETQELNGNMYRPVGRSFGETEVLDRNAAPIPEVSFECTEHVMITHTDEVI